ncbi:hypothetical protein D3C87_2142760 [compost metagenome]
MRGLQEASSLLDPTSKATLELVLFGVRQLADAADKTLVGLDAIDTQVFGVSGGQK